MGKVMSLMAITTDGFIDGQFAKADAEFVEFWLGLLSETKTVAFGRNTFELFRDLQIPRLENESTPEWQMKMARTMTDIPKEVYSSTMQTATWNNTTIIPKINVEHINSYKQEGSGGLHIVGSPSLVATLTGMNLIDDYYFCVQPIIAGKGSLRLFDKINLDTPHPLKYVDSTQLKSGVHIIHYQNIP